jgi:hypothetical protein
VLVILTLSLAVGAVTKVAVIEKLPVIVRLNEDALPATGAPLTDIDPKAQPVVACVAMMVNVLPMGNDAVHVELHENPEVDANMWAATLPFPMMVTLTVALLCAKAALAEKYEITAIKKNRIQRRMYRPRI